MIRLLNLTDTLDTYECDGKLGNINRVLIYTRPNKINEPFSCQDTRNYNQEI